jgi:hypothetical protein
MAPSSSAEVAEEDDMFGDDFEIPPHPAVGVSGAVLTRDEEDEGLSVSLMEGHDTGDVLSTGHHGVEFDIMTGSEGVQAVRHEEHSQPGVTAGKEGGHGVLGSLALAEEGLGRTQKEGDEQGFELDPDSGMYYNSNIGFYFDPSTQRWCDAATGEWYSLENGQYVAVQYRC